MSWSIEALLTRELRKEFSGSEIEIDRNMREDNCYRISLQMSSDNKLAEVKPIIERVLLQVIFPYTPIEDVQINRHVHYLSQVSTEVSHLNKYGHDIELLLYVSCKGKNPPGHPKKKVDEQKAIDLAKIMCTNVEIATILNISENTLVSNTELYGRIKKAREDGKASLRRMQYKQAENSAAMAIFLGKNYLAQRDKHDIEENKTVNILFKNGEEDLL